MNGTRSSGQTWAPPQVGGSSGSACYRKSPYTYEDVDRADLAQRLLELSPAGRAAMYEAHMRYTTLVEQTMGADFDDPDALLKRAVPSLAKVEASNPASTP